MTTLTPQVPGSENFLFWIQIQISRQDQTDRERFTYADSDWVTAQNRWQGVMADARSLSSEIRCATLCLLHGKDEVVLEEWQR